jgi:uncharacterized protein DUF2383
MQTTTEKSSQVIDTLSNFLRGEMSAVETFRQALEKFQNPSLRGQLQDCMQSHQSRVELLRNRIVTLGGSPPTGSGAWGSFAKLVEGGAKVFGEQAAISALEAGEDHGRDDYRRDLDKLDVETRSWIQAQILPAQERTHAIVSALKKSRH